MSPELAARVEAAVTGKPVGSSKMPPILVSLLRFGTVAAVLVGAGFLIFKREKCQDELDSERALLVADVQKLSAGVTPEQKDMVSHVEKWLGEHSKEYEGD